MVHIIYIGRFGPESTCSPIYNETLETQLNDVIENLDSEIDNIQIDEISDNEEISIPAIPEVRNFSYTIIDNKIYYRENSLMYCICQVNIGPLSN